MQLKVTGYVPKGETLKQTINLMFSGRGSRGLKDQLKEVLYSNKKEARAELYDNDKLVKRTIRVIFEYEDEEVN